MIKYYYTWMLTFVLVAASILLLPLIRSSVNAGPPQQYPITDSQNSSCDDLYEQKSEEAPPAPEEKKAAEFLQNDPQVRAATNGVAPPIANKVLDCGLIP